MEKSRARAGAEKSWQAQFLAMSTKPKFISLSFTHSKSRDDSFDVKIVRTTHHHIPREHRSFYYALPSWYRDEFIFAAENRTDAYFTVIKTIGGAQAPKTVVGALLIFVGAREPLWVPI